MKKLIILALALIQAMAVGIASASPAAGHQLTGHREILSTAGKVESIDAKRLLVVGKGDHTAVNLVVTDDTYVLDGNTGAAMLLTDIKENTPLTAYYGSQLTRSIPPQGKAAALIVGETEQQQWFYLKVKEVEHLANGAVQLLDVNGDRLITVLPAEFAAIDSIRTGSELLVSYKMMTMSMPGKAVSEKTILLKTGSDLVIDADDLIFKNGTTYLPLRSTLAKLGYKIEWYEDSQSILVYKGVHSANLTIDSTIYGKLKMRIDLPDAPILLDNVTYAPMAFFTNVLDLAIETKNIPLK